MPRAILSPLPVPLAGTCHRCRRHFNGLALPIGEGSFPSSGLESAGRSCFDIDRYRQRWRGFVPTQGENLGVVVHYRT